MKQQENHLAERAMLVRLSIGSWHGIVTDKQAARELAEQKKAKAALLKLRKKVMPADALRGIESVISIAREEHKAVSLPWSDGGYRIMLDEGYFRFIERSHDFIEQFNEEVNAFVPKYMEFWEKIKPDLGDLAHLSDIPQSEAELRKKFYMSIKVYPLPQADDFRVTLANGSMAQVRQSIEDDVRTSIADGMREPWQRLHKHIAHLIERLKSDGAFHASNVTNIEDLLDIIPMLNITRDKALDKITDEIRKSLLVDAFRIRKDKDLRSATSDKAAKILKKIDAYI